MHPRPPDPDAALSLRALTKRFGATTAADGLDLDVPRGSFYGLVGPNGAGKTTTLSMATGLRLFDRLTGEQLVTYSGLLRGMERDVVTSRARELLEALGLAEAASTLVVDYSAGMTKKVALASALVHAPRVLVLDEPFEAVDPVSAATIRQILAGYVGSGGTVVLSSHVMDLVQRLCDHVAIVAAGRIRAAGTLDAVREGSSLEDRFVELVGGRTDVGEALAWLRPSSG